MPAFTALCALACGACFAALAWLYGLPAEAVLYGGLLSLFVLICAFAVRFLMLRARIRTLHQLAAAPTRNHRALRDLPDPGDSLEAAYLALVRTLIAQEEKLSAGVDRATGELLDSYTLWMHQIKTPIAALHLMLQAEPDSERVRGMRMEVLKIEQYAEMALHLLRLEEGVSDLVLERQDLVPLVHAAIRKHRTFFIERKLSLQLTLMPTMVLTDAKWCAVILEQLISNAIKYTREGGLTIRQADTDPRSLILSDTGIGIRPEDLPRVFEKGFTGYNGRSDLRATGLGLHLVRRACDRLGILISLASTVGCGTEVRLTFPPPPDNLAEM